MLKKFNPFNKWTIGEKRKKNYNFFSTTWKIGKLEKIFLFVSKNWVLFTMGLLLLLLLVGILAVSDGVLLLLVLLLVLVSHYYWYTTLIVYYTSLYSINIRETPPTVRITPLPILRVTSSFRYFVIS